MITRYIKGDITETELKYIAHGVNCQNKMGSGVAKALFTKFPNIKSEYHDYLNGLSYIKYSVELGEVQTVLSKNKVIFNCFTQWNYGYDGKKYVNYSAIVKSFINLLDKVGYEIAFGHPIAIPKIGCGLAGGDWNIVEQLINDTVGDDLEIWVYELEDKKSSGRNDLA